MEKARAGRSTGPGRAGTEHALDELRVAKSPEPELLLELEQRFGDEKRQLRSGSEVELLQCSSLLFQVFEEEILERRAVEPALHQRWNRPLRPEHFDELRITQTGRGLDGAKLHALRTARSAEVRPEFREMLRG